MAGSVEGGPLNAAEFVAKWKRAELKERSAAQEHFLDLCRMLGHPTPAAADPTGESFCFEKGAEKHDEWLAGQDAKPRHLTRLYNERPTWLDLAHQKLAAAVFAAFGWATSMTDADLLAALLVLNQERAKA
jgi:hypothetical protein